MFKLLTFLLISLCPLLVFAEGGSVYTSYDSSGDRNTITKWCSEDGKKVRYSSDNLTLKGFERCGKIEGGITCDSSGNKYITGGPSGSSTNNNCDNIQKEDDDYEFDYSSEEFDEIVDENVEKSLVEYQDFRNEEGKHIINKRLQKEKSKIDAYFDEYDKLIDGN